MYFIVTWNNRLQKGLKNNNNNTYFYIIIEFHILKVKVRPEVQGKNYMCNIYLQVTYKQYVTFILNSVNASFLCHILYIVRLIINYKKVKINSLL